MAKVVSVAVFDMPFECPLGVGGVQIVGDEDRVLALALAPLEADLLRGSVAASVHEAVEVGRRRRVPIRAGTALAVAVVRVCGERVAVDVAERGVGASRVIPGVTRKYLFFDLARRSQNHDRSS